MKTKTALILSLVIVSSLLSCKNNSNEVTSTGSTTKGTSSLQIDNETQNSVNPSGVLDTKFQFNNNEQFAEGLSLKISIALEDNTGVYISFNNNDLKAKNVILGTYTTSINTAFTASDFKFGQVTVSGAKGYFSSRGTSTDAIKLTKCDITGGKVSGAFDAILTNKETNETMHVVGSFTDLSLMVSL